LLAGCATLPDPVVVDVSQAMPAAGQTTLGRQVIEMSGRHPGKSAIVIEDTGRDALLHRAALIEAAERSIDIQYYIWHTDTTGDYLAARLLGAAQRGVQVRVLLDDLHFAGDQATMERLDRHPNIEVRTYNPSRARGMRRWLAYLRDFGRLNRRLHNKTFVVDGAVGITGGRNIGDGYFDLDPEMNFRDRDLLAAGPVVQSMSDCFDDYWNNPWSYPLASVATNGVQEEPAPGAAVRPETGIPVPLPRDRESALAILEPLLGSAEWAPAEFAWDPAPDDLEADAVEQKHTALVMADLVARTRHELLIESGYLLLEQEELEVYAALEERGVRVVALTNSLASNNLVTNHSGYARWRGRMAYSGLQLHELRPHPRACARWIDSHGYCGKAVVSLHSKSAVIDGDTLYVGSFNFNQRSIYLNAESVVIVRSERLAREVADEMRLAFDDANSWMVDRNDDGDLTWRAGDGEIWTREPASTPGRRLRSWLYARFPVEKYL
jgi:putative cardiolipin synthase